MESLRPNTHLSASVQRTIFSARSTTSVIMGSLSFLFKIFTLFARVLTILIAAMAGNYVGDKLRGQLTGEPGHQLEFVHRDEHGNTFIAANLLLSNYLPALLLAFVARPSTIFAFLGGIVFSFFLGDRYEDQLWETLDEILSGGDPTRDWPKSTRVIDKP